jgi:DNA-binding GntR family transcriptional regulator
VARPSGYLAEHAYAVLRDWILTGHLGPGEQLRELHLGPVLGVSRTPLREAMQRLVAEGFATAVPNVGVFVRKLTWEGVYTLLECRRSLEAGAAALAATKATSGQAKDLVAQAQRLDQASLGAEAEGTAPEELRFHRRILELAGNAELEASVANAQLIYWTLGPRGAGPSLPPATRTLPHVAIADAIAGGDPVAAFAAMWDHIGLMLERLQRAETAPPRI